MNVIELQNLRKSVEPVIIEAGKKLKASYGNIAHSLKASEEHVGAVVTELDLDTERFLYEQFKIIDPSIGFRGEEFGVSTEGERTWLVDPIDGTGHFIRGLPFCTSMVALIDSGQVVMSFIYHFVTGEMYWAIKGEGAYCNDQRLYVSNRALNESLISFESKLAMSNNVELYNELNTMTNFIKTINCGWEFSMIASGKIDGRIAKDPYGMDWDFAPGSLLVQEAGGIATNIGKVDYDYRNHDYLVTNPVIHKELTEGPTALFPV